MRNNAIVQIGRGPLAARFGPEAPLALIAGPCQVESRAHALEMAGALKAIAARRAIGLVFKSSFDKANRTSGASARGVGLKAALPIFAEIRETLGLPVITDVHESGQCVAVAEAVDALQIPAFLCRQTDLLVAAALTGRAVNVKKGQFLAMDHPARRQAGRWPARDCLTAVHLSILSAPRRLTYRFNNNDESLRRPVAHRSGAPRPLRPRPVTPRESPRSGRTKFSSAASTPGRTAQRLIVSPSHR